MLEAEDAAAAAALGRFDRFCFGFGLFAEDEEDT